MNSQVSALRQAVHAQAKELAKYRLTSINTAYNTPYIEHWVLQLHGVEPGKIDDPDRLLGALGSVVDDLHLTRVSDHSHYFGPGVSSVIILSESHLSAHTWPELGYLHVDVVTCVKKLTLENLERAFRAAFAPEHIQLVQLEY